MMMIIIIQARRALSLFWGWLGLVWVWVTYYLSPPSFFFLVNFGRGWDRMGGKKLWERAWDDGLTGVFACWERPLL